MLTISLIAQGLYLVASLAISARLTARTKNAVWGGLSFYGLYILWAILFCIVIPVTLERLGVDGHQIDHAFPEAIGVPAVLLLGWAPAIVFAGFMGVLQQYSRRAPGPGKDTTKVAHQRSQAKLPAPEPSHFPCGRQAGPGIVMLNEVKHLARG